MDPSLARSNSQRGNGAFPALYFSCLLVLTLRSGLPSLTFILSLILNWGPSNFTFLPLAPLSLTSLCTVVTPIDIAHIAVIADCHDVTGVRWPMHGNALLTVSQHRRKCPDLSAMENQKDVL